MKGFQMIDGDIVIENNEIQMVSGAELTRQTVETVLNTNKGEWFFDSDEGITFSNILGKNQKIKSEYSDIVKSEILDGLSQVDSSFSISEFSADYNSTIRKLTAKFTAYNENGETVEVVDVWQD